MKMSKEARREKILDLINSTKMVTSEELSKLFNVTEETIRKDLTYLSEQGHIIRTFGGATIKDDSDQPLVQRSIQYYVEKEQIARQAVKLILDKDLIVMDAGSTITVLARHIRPQSNVVALTNSLEIMNVLSKVEGVTVISTGGKLRTKSMSFQGINAERSIGLCNLQKAFVSCEAVDLQKGVMDANEAEAQVKMRMIEEAREVYLLADHSKFQSIAHITTCKIEEITAIITDSGIDPEIVRAFQDAGVKMIIAD